MADASSNVEDLLINEYGSKLDCDVLKVAHHGSKFSTSLEFLQTTTPDYSIISVGENFYGHPTQEVLSNLTQVNSKILRTDINGSIIFTVGEDYNLTYNYNKYIISGFIADYRLFVLIIDVFMFFQVVIIILKKQKNKHSTN
jgi:beta-lactamase superfamily II metal-dependent hydrolase